MKKIFFAASAVLMVLGMQPTHAQGIVVAEHPDSLIDSYRQRLIDCDDPSLKGTYVNILFRTLEFVLEEAKECASSTNMPEVPRNLRCVRALALLDAFAFVVEKEP